LKKKRDKAKMAQAFDVLVKNLEHNQKMVNIYDYTKIASQGIGVGIKAGKIYECPYKIG